MGRGARLPEQTVYVDTGCEVAPRCLECPLPRCKYEEPGGRVPAHIRERQRRINLLYDEGWSPRAIAAREGVSVRSVHRARKAAYDRGG